jgi:DNA (cytosine-5)-methyltransferase 1
MNKTFSYVSLFSGGGVGNFAFKELGYRCFLTSELIERRLNVQKANNICEKQSDYITGDIKDPNIKQIIEKSLKNKKIDLIVATPPCQGMSVANHKKNDKDKLRNSLILESINIVKKFKPKIFVFENVRSFLKTLCTDNNGKLKSIDLAIKDNLSSLYNIETRIINFAEYGANSNRTRTLVIGSLKSLHEVNPANLFPDKRNSPTLKELIYRMPRLKKMGQISKKDILHHFKKYDPIMEKWIEDTLPGMSAFDQKDKNKIPARIINGEKIYNANKNGDKYKRCEWDKIAPCIHTRNDIIASQSTIHPTDNRVFSIRELMILMNIPESFSWFTEKYNSLDEKEKILKKHQINIRQCIGEGVPTSIFSDIGLKIIESLNFSSLSITELKKIQKENQIEKFLDLKKFINKNFNKYNFYELSKIREFFNFNKITTKAFYTRSDISKLIVSDLPIFEKQNKIRILEPSVGSGSFIPHLIEKYRDKNVTLDLIDIDKDTIQLLKILIKKLSIPKNFKINFIHCDYLNFKVNKKYDLILTNPPFGKICENEISIQSELLKDRINTKNMFALFLYKSCQEAKHVAYITPKSLLNAPEFNQLRSVLEKLVLRSLHDYGEKAFKGVLIETISIQLAIKKQSNKKVYFRSFIDNKTSIIDQKYIQDEKLPNWLIYRNKEFDKLLKKLKLDIFDFFRDRQITKKNSTKLKKPIRVIKSRNIKNLKVIKIREYDTFIHDYNNLVVSKFLNKKKIIIPNLTYYPRAAFLPKNSLCDGSVAILFPKNGISIKERDLEFYSTQEFKNFYAIARNKGTRSLNIDRNSIFFWGIKKQINLF